MDNTIRLNFVNNSSDQNNNSIVIFTKSNDSNPAKAWLVLPNTTSGSRIPFTFDLTHEVTTTDGNGNFSPAIEASEGERFHIVSRDNSAPVMRFKSPSANPNWLEFENNLDDGVVRVVIYKNGRVYQEERGLMPGKVADFDLEPYLWCAVAEGINEGDNVPQSVVDDAIIKLDLTGIVSADIVMTGGGDKPYIFTLQDVQEEGAEPETTEKESSGVETIFLS